MTLLAAHTPCENAPPYINFSAGDYGVRVIVRGRPTGDAVYGSEADFLMTPEEFTTLLRDLNKNWRPLATGLRCAVEDGEIVIRLPLDAMKVAAEGADFIHHIDPSTMDLAPPERDFCVTDPAAFADEVVRALNAEAEDGTTKMHEMFDDAFEEVVNDGGEGFVWPAGGVDSVDEMFRVSAFAEIPDSPEKMFVHQSEWDRLAAAGNDMTQFTLLRPLLPSVQDLILAAEDKATA